MERQSVCTCEGEGGKEEDGREGGKKEGREERREQVREEVLGGRRERRQELPPPFWPLPPLGQVLAELSSPSSRPPACSHPPRA